jgi:hypothetical protein
MEAGLGALLLEVGYDAAIGVFDGLTAVGGHHALKRLRTPKTREIPTKPPRITILLALMLGALLIAPGCSPAERAGIPIISQIDAVGMKAAQLLGWCESHGGDAVAVKRAADALADEDYITAIEETTRIVEALRRAGKPIPSEIEIGLRLAQGTLEGLKTAQALENASRALADD